jgi:hypothetical protein
MNTWKLFATEAERALARLAAARLAGERRAQADAHDVELSLAARRHGMEMLLLGSQDEPTARRALALELQHQASREQLARIGDALDSARVDAIVLKGLSLAERFYDPAWSRPGTDVDLLVDPAALSTAERALESIGYEVESGARGRFFRERHVHLHLDAEGRLPVELHFIALRGFGREIGARDLFEGAVPSARLGTPFHDPDIARELVYVAAHAAQHRFARMGWLFDLALMSTRASSRDLARASDVAKSLGLSRPFVAALRLSRSLFGVPEPSVARAHAPWSALGIALAPEPEWATARSATRLVYTLLLCDGAAARARYTTRALVDRVVMPRCRS